MNENEKKESNNDDYGIYMFCVCVFQKKIHLWMTNKWQNYEKKFSKKKGKNNEDVLGN